MSLGVQRSITALSKQWRPLKRRTFPCFSGWIAAPARARGRPLRLLRTRLAVHDSKKKKSANIGAEHSHPHNPTGAAGNKEFERAGDEDALSGLSARFFTIHSRSCVSVLAQLQSWSSACLAAVSAALMLGKSPGIRSTRASDVLTQNESTPPIIHQSFREWSQIEGKRLPNKS